MTKKITSADVEKLIEADQNAKNSELLKEVLLKVRDQIGKRQVFIANRNAQIMALREVEENAKALFDKGLFNVDVHTQFMTQLVQLHDLDSSKTTVPEPAILAKRAVKV